MSKSNRSIGQAVVGLVATVIGVMVAGIALLAGVLGTGLAVGRALDLLQGAQPRLLSDWTVALDGWALLFAAYVLLWLPLTAVIKSIRQQPDGLLPDIDDDG